ncbi:hypothetical protein N7457_003736 [Penicillium paradoxum]|uniref:uncharacterized protein n=1 Tax=Penicillium paradoxum TaxID=176176 RepID=UPI002549AF6A|nr:uncharacterized protein N7457_003736 [Penicillium paradoxum]KAJ5788746.1 hypothetical protein N7457_003736 [Penicillium paradoxum]
MPGRLYVVNAPESHVIRSEMMVNHSAARMRRRSGILGPREEDGIPREPQASPDRLTASEDLAVIDYVTRWRDHGFHLKKQDMVSQIASAYLKHCGNPDSGISRHHGIFARNHEFHEKFKNDRKLEKQQLSNKNPEVEDTTLCEFIKLFAAIRSKHDIQDEQTYVLSDTGYATAIQKDKRLLNIRRRGSSGNRELASVIYCHPACGKPLSPYVIFKSSNVRGPKKYDGRVTISYNTTGWAETTHALDWLNSVFERETSSSLRRNRGQRRDQNQHRLLLIDESFPVTPEFFVNCWERKVICLCIPKKGSEYLNPFDNGIIEALDKLYAEHMKKQLREHMTPHLQLQGPYTISASQFATFVDRELSYPDREEESKGAWSQACLIPADGDRLLSRRKGDRIRSQTVEPNTPTRAYGRHTYLDTSSGTENTNAATDVEEASIAASVIVPQDQSPSRQSLQESQPRETRGEISPESETSDSSEDIEDSDGIADKVEQDESEQSSSDESCNIAAVTPRRTPKQPKTPRSSPPRASPTVTSSVISNETFSRMFDKYEAASSKSKKRLREEMVIEYAKCIWELQRCGIKVPRSSKKSRAR